MNQKGQIIHQIKAATHLNDGGSALKKQIIAICQELVKEHGNICAIGVGSASPLHAEQGILLDPMNFGWKQKKVHFTRDLKKNDESADRF